LPTRLTFATSSKASIGLAIIPLKDFTRCVNSVNV
jgi:hypothetical protein